MVSGVRKPKALRVTDVQRDDLVPDPLELVGTLREPAANLVSDVTEALAGADCEFGFHGAVCAPVRWGRLLAGYQSRGNECRFGARTVTGRRTNCSCATPAQPAAE